MKNTAGDRTVRLTIDLDIDSEAVGEHGVSEQDVVNGLRLFDHDIIDGFELTTDIPGHNRTEHFFLCNGRIASKELLPALDEKQRLLIWPELRFYGAEDHEMDLAYDEDQEWCDCLGQFRIVFDVADGERYYCNIEAHTMTEAIGIFFKEHPHITYDMVVDHMEV